MTCLGVHIYFSCSRATIPRIIREVTHAHPQRAASSTTASCSMPKQRPPLTQSTYVDRSERAGGPLMGIDFAACAFVQQPYPSRRKR